MIEQIPYCPPITLDTQRAVHKKWQKMHMWHVLIFFGILSAFYILNGFLLSNSSGFNWLLWAFLLPVLASAIHYRKPNETHLAVSLPTDTLPSLAVVQEVLTTSKAYRKNLPAIGCYAIAAKFYHPSTEFPIFVGVAAQQLDGETKIYVSAYGFNTWGGRKQTEKYAQRIASGIAAKLTEN